MASRLRISRRLNSATVTTNAAGRPKRTNHGATELRSISHASAPSMSQSVSAARTMVAAAAPTSTAATSQATRCGPSPRSRRRTGWITAYIASTDKPWRQKSAHRSFST